MRNVNSIFFYLPGGFGSCFFFKADDSFSNGLAQCLAGKPVHLVCVFFSLSLLRQTLSRDVPIVTAGSTFGAEERELCLPGIIRREKEREKEKNAIPA